MTLYRVLADATVVIHVVYASFIVLALVAILIGVALHWSWIRNFWFRLAHLLMIGGVAVETCCGIPCPLTILENRFRLQAGEATYPGSFIGELSNDALFFEAPEWLFSLTYLLVFGLILATFVVAAPRWPTWVRSPRNDERPATTSDER